MGLAVSLLENGPHTVTVYPKVKTKNQYNSWDFVDGPPVVMNRVAVQPMGASPTKPVSETVETDLTDQVRTNLRVIGIGSWPGGPNSHVIVEGRDYDQKGEVAVFDMSPRTAHWMVILQARSVEVK